MASACGRAGRAIALLLFTGSFTNM